MSSGGQLILTLRKSVGGLELLIADTGHGIPAEQLKRITEPWYCTGKEEPDWGWRSP
ncbi:MAG: hypothetical protein R3B96_05645 [Pirellulaceae bacterium]